MRSDSPFVLALGGTAALHLFLVVAIDAVTVIYPYRPSPPAPRVELVEVEVPKPEPPKPPPPPVAKEPEPEPEPPPREQPKPRQKVAAQELPPPPETAPPPIPDDPTPAGGDEVVQMPDIAPGATGVAVKPGKRNTGHVGRGGSGGGTGAGSGSGTAEEPPAPVSVATIKTRAMPKGDYSYFTGADYPAEAKQLGIEGSIKVRLIVDDKGKVKSAVLLNRLGSGLDELALLRAKQIEFDPAKDTEDKPVASVVVWTFHMTLPK